MSDSNQKVLILGAGGQLAEAFERLLSQRQSPYLALTWEQADFSKPQKLRLPLSGMTAVINCGAYTNVDGAEEDEKTARNVNGEAVGVIAQACKAASIPLVHFSTDYVFDGAGNTPLVPEHPRAPLNAYGRTKALGEELLEQSGADYLLVRTSWVYSSWGVNFVKTMARLTREKDSLKVVDDQRGRPTHVTGLAERSLALLEKGHRGTFHCTDEGECTWFGFTQAIRDAIGAECKIIPCTTAEFPRPAVRPAYGVLDTQKTDALLGPAKHYREWLALMAADL
jgi:dTDP-4-dehydrorhamnose reductase